MSVAGPTGPRAGSSPVCSGAMEQGVPRADVVRVMPLPESSGRARPKSTSFGISAEPELLPAARSTLSDLMSRCTMPSA